MYVVWLACLTQCEVSSWVSDQQNSFSNPSPLPFFYIGGQKPTQNAEIPTQWARKDRLMSRGKNCRETILPLTCLAITPTAGLILKEDKKPSLVGGERQFGRHFSRQFGRGSLRVKNCLETVGRQFLPRDINLSRRARWGKKNLLLPTNFFEKFARTFAFFPVTRVKNPTEIAKKNLFR